VVYHGNPIMNGHFISDSCYIGCGFDNVPMVFKKAADGNWTFEGSMDPGYHKTRQQQIKNNAFGGQTAFFEGYESTADSTSVPKDTIH
jgi:hypothetical protein